MNVVYGCLLILSIKSTLSTATNLTDVTKDQTRNQYLVEPTLFYNRTSYSGLLPVDKIHDSHLFFWYILAENYKPNTPWIIWLQGGPGATSLAGLFDEIGPFSYDMTEKKLKLREWSWAKDHSILFIDNPVGTGYSFTNSPEGYALNTVTCADHLFSALRQFLMVFPELRKAPLYIAGESYAGRYIPEFASSILKRDPYYGFLKVNLQGIMLGNPIISRKSIWDYGSAYYHWGLIDSQEFMAVKPLQDQYLKAINDNEPETAAQLREDILTKLEDMTARTQSYNVLTDTISHLHDFGDLLQDPAIQKALHVENRQFNFRNSTVSEKLRADFLGDAEPNIEMLLDKNIRVLIYCGQLDMMAPCVPNAQARRSWHWSHRDQFLNAPRTPWSYNYTIAGYVKSGGGLTEVLVRGAGHLAPMDKPAEVTQLITYFIQHRVLEQPSNYKRLSQDTSQFVEDFDEFLKSSLFSVQTKDNTLVAVSIVFNVVFIIVIVCGVVYFLKWKRRTNDFLYSTVEDANDSMSTMC